MGSTECSLGKRNRFMHQLLENSEKCCILVMVVDFGKIYGKR
jgi:hypothetical protein